MRAIVGVVVLLAVSAPPGTGQVIAGPDGPVEFIGLQDWSAQELFDAIQATAPGQPFHACARTMKEVLGFADAAAKLTNETGDQYTIVVGVEDSARVRYRPVGNEAVALPEAWREVATAVGDDLLTVSAIEGALPWRGGFLDRVFNRSWRRAREMGGNPEILDQVWDFVDNADSEEDRQLAHGVLASDSSWSARVVAVLVLGNSVADDTSWHALASAAIDPRSAVSSVARAMLVGMSKRRKDPVEWTGARVHLSALLDGTNPSHFDGILQMLVATGIDPQFGRQLVRESPDLLLAHARAEHEPTRAQALAFLRAVSGEDHGTDVEAWTAWVTGQPD